MINRALRLIRIFHQLEIVELAHILEITPVELLRIESGKKAPSNSLVEKYSNYFNVPFQNFLFFLPPVYIAIDNPINHAMEKTRYTIAKTIIRVMEFIVNKT